MQRITKYQLLLREVLRLTERTKRTSEIETLRAAVHVMRIIPKQANDMMDVGRLQGFDVSFFITGFPGNGEFFNNWIHCDFRGKLRRRVS